MGPCPKAGAEPPAEVDNQFPPDRVDAEALKLAAWLPWLSRENTCVDAAAPVVNEKESKPGWTESVGPLPPLTVIEEGIGMLTDWEYPISEALMFNVRAKLYWPAVVGVPLTSPLEWSESPGGRLPLVRENE